MLVSSYFLFPQFHLTLPHLCPLEQSLFLLRQSQASPLSLLKEPPTFTSVHASSSEVVTV